MHPYWRRLLCLSTIVIFGAGCNHLGGAAQTTTPSQAAIGPAARQYLASNEDEEEGYGFYSYLLLPKAAANAATLERYRAAFDAFLRITPSDKQRLQPARLNLTYALVTDRPPASVSSVMAGALPDDARRKAAIDWLIENHDYARSAEILSRIPGADAPGPFIVQAPEPIASVTDSSQVLVQDLSTIPSNLIGDLVDHVLTASDRKQSWTDDELKTYLIQVRSFWERLGINVQRVTALVAWLPIDKVLQN